MAGLGMIGTAMAGAAYGAGKVGEEAMDYVKKATLADQAAEIQKLRDATLEGYASSREQRQYGHAEELQRGGFKHAETLQAGQQEFTKSENKANRDFQTEEHRLNRELQASQHKETIGLHLQQLKLARDTFDFTRQEIKLQPLGDGTILKLDKTGQVIGPLADPLTGGVYKGAKDLPAGTLKYLDIVKESIEGMQNELRVETDPARKAALQAKVDLAVHNAGVISGVMTGAPSGEQGRTGWDPGTNKVIVNGKEIGEAKSKVQSDRMIADALSGKTATAVPAKAGGPAPAGAAAEPAWGESTEGRTMITDWMERMNPRIGMVKQAMGR